MATLLERKSKSGKSLFTVQFTRGHRRPCVPLGQVTKSQASEIKGYIERLAASRRVGSAIDGTVAAWLAERDESFYGKLVTVGLADPRVVPEPEPEPTLPAKTLLIHLIDTYIRKRSDVKDGTAVVYGHTRRCLLDYFGVGKAAEDITPGDADDFRRWLTLPTDKSDDGRPGQGLADNTARRRCGIAKQFFRDAVRRRLLAENPFAEMKGIGVVANRERDKFVSREEADKVLAACPDSQWRLIFALSRYGGLRCPSEHLALRWGDIDWEGQRMHVRSPKTAHHEGKASRVVPLFGELRPYLDAVFDEAPEGAEFVITRYRDCNANLRTQLLRIIKLAGLKPWPKLFQNLRATRATELAAEYPGHVAAEWLGHSTKVADKHYWQTTDADFARAVELRAANALLQQPTAAESDGNEGRDEIANRCNVHVSSEFVASGLGDAGLEPATSAL